LTASGETQKRRNPRIRRSSRKDEEGKSKYEELRKKKIKNATLRSRVKTLPITGKGEPAGKTEVALNQGKTSRVFSRGIGT